MDPADAKLAAVIRRVLVEMGLNLDPFTLLELATMMQPVLRGSTTPYAARSAEQTIIPILRRIGVDKPEETASRIVAEIARRIKG